MHEDVRNACKILVGKSVALGLMKVADCCRFCNEPPGFKRTWEFLD
jgi:hypothetical protein